MWALVGTGEKQRLIRVGEPLVWVRLHDAFFAEVELPLPS
jgi:hypothetical protein